MKRFKDMENIENVVECSAILTWLGRDIEGCADKQSPIK
jgi:hypothetical protein